MEWKRNNYIMKICWDNLENLIYSKKTGKLYKRKNTSITFVFKESCLNCGDPFLGIEGNINKYCDLRCRRHSKETKNKISGTKKDQNLTSWNIGKKGKDSLGWKGGYHTNNISMYDTYAHQISFCEEVRRNKKDDKILEVKCAYCGKWHIPKMTDVVNRIRGINELHAGERRLYCSIICKNECPIYRQVKWPKDFKPATSREVQPELRQMCFERDDFTCQKCGNPQDELDVGLHCHHIEGIRWEPLESADLDKVITYCKTCHIEVHKQPDCGYHDMRCPE